MKQTKHLFVEHLRNAALHHYLNTSTDARVSDLATLLSCSESTVRKLINEAYKRGLHSSGLCQERRGTQHPYWVYGPSRAFLAELVKSARERGWPMFCDLPSKPPASASASASAPAPASEVP